MSITYATFFTEQKSLDLAQSATAHINIIIIVGAIFSLIFVASELPLLVVPGNDFCHNYYYVKVLSFASAIFCIYFALWYRVFALFYRNKFMRKSIPKYLQYINIAAMPLLCVMIISNVVVFLSSPGYVSAGCACNDIENVDGNPVNRTIRWIFLILSILCFQIVLLFSFIHPLHLHRKKMLRTGMDYKATVPLVKRAAIVGVICILSDLIDFGFAVIFQSPTLYIFDIIIRCNVVVNLIATIMAFASWRMKLFPFNKKLHPNGVTKTSQLTQTDTQQNNINVTNEAVL